MMNNRVFIVLAKTVVVISLLSGCSTISYVPSVSLDKSDRTIDAKVRFDGYVDITPEGDHESRAFGFSATHKDSLVGDLSTSVSNAILDDFRGNYVFSEIGKHVENPDYIISGTINRFSGKAGLLWYTIPVDVLWFLGLPCCKEEGIVEISTDLKTPDGNVVSSIKSESSSDSWYTLYNNRTFSLPSQMNKSFQNVVLDIRQKLLTDYDDRVTAKAALNN